MKNSFNFFKYHHLGNDFIVVDGREKILKEKYFLKNLKKIISEICKRKFSIGADGLVILKEFRKNFKMDFFNKDGSKAEICGNALLCLQKFISKVFLKNPSGKKILIHTEKDIVEGKYQNKKAAIFLKTPSFKNVFIYKEDNFFKKLKGIFVDCQVPHIVFFVKNLKDIDIEKEAKKIQNHPVFKKEGINVNFAKKEGNEIYLRTFERGVEEETFSCGTGAISTAFAAKLKECKVFFEKGEVLVSFEKNKAKLSGFPKFVYNGSYLIY